MKLQSPPLMLGPGVNPFRISCPVYPCEKPAHCTIDNVHDVTTGSLINTWKRRERSSIEFLVCLGETSGNALTSKMVVLIKGPLPSSPYLGLGSNPGKDNLRRLPNSSTL